MKKDIKLKPIGTFFVFILIVSLVGMFFLFVPFLILSIISFFIVKFNEIKEPKPTIKNKDSLGSDYKTEDTLLFENEKGKIFGSVGNQKAEPLKSVTIYVTPDSIVQILETVKIMMESRDVETIDERRRFLKQIHNDICKACEHPKYEYTTRHGIDKFKLIYYDSNYPKEFYNCVLKPIEFYNNIPEFSNICFKKAINQYYNYQIEQIEGLKTIKGKLNRRIKLQEYLKDSYLYLGNPKPKEIMALMDENQSEIDKMSLS